MCSLNQEHIKDATLIVCQLAILAQLACVADLALGLHEAVADYLDEAPPPSASSQPSQQASQNPHYENGAHNRYLNSFLTPMTGDVSYEAYKGDGTVDQGWPDQTDWVDFRNM